MSDLPCDDVLTSCVLAVPVLGRPQSHRVQDRRPARRPALAEHVVQRCVTTAMLRGPAQPDQGFHRVPRRTAAHRTVPAAHRPAGQGTAGRGSPAAAAGPQPPLHRQRRCLGPHRAARPLPIPRSLATPEGSRGGRPMKCADFPSWLGGCDGTAGACPRGTTHRPFPTSATMRFERWPEEDPDDALEQRFAKRPRATAMRPTTSTAWRPRPVRLGAARPQQEDGRPPAASVGLVVLSTPAGASRAPGTSA